jgi:sentrin-specific protease 1
MDKKKRPFDFTGWIDHYDEVRSSSTRRITSNGLLQDTPQQENGYDCGVFTCQFMESLSRGVDEFVFDQDDMPYIRDRMTWEIGRSKLWEDSDC